MTSPDGHEVTSSDQVKKSADGHDHGYGHGCGCGHEEVMVREVTPADEPNLWKK